MIGARNGIGNPPLLHSADDLLDLPAQALVLLRANGA